MSSFPPSLSESFSSSLHSPNSIARNEAQKPNHFVYHPSALHANATLSSFVIGTGANLYTQHTETILSTQYSLTIVTCFWARSRSLDTLITILRKLSSHALADGPCNKIRVRICFSSLSLVQKLFHTRSLAGKAWPPSTWVSKLGLPHPSELKGLDLRIKSIFILPFSVIHPKFVIMDQRTVSLPSCNVSWEDWLEGCTTLSGDIVQQFVRFYDTFWADEGDKLGSIAHNSDNPPSITATIASSPLVPAIFLPSSHHVSPHFRFLPFTSAPAPPPTPLNTFLLTSISHASHNIVITTPNLTCPAVVDALLSAVTTGVNVTIYTSRRMMLLEQLITAGTTTEICVWWLRRRYRKLLRSTAAASDRADANGHSDVEAQRHSGRLRVYYFNPTSPKGGEVCRANKLHFKSTVIDDEFVVLGSGNMDRASWYTSQELGVAFASRELADQVQRVFQAFLTKSDGGMYLEQVI